MAGHQTTFVNYNQTCISSWSHNQNSQKHIWKRFKGIEIISKHYMIAQSEDNIKNRKSELCICCVFWFCKIGTLENRRNFHNCRNNFLVAALKLIPLLNFQMSPVDKIACGVEISPCSFASIFLCFEFVTKLCSP